MKPFVVPFTVIADTREQCPYLFDAIPADVGEGGGILSVPVCTNKLDTGDYSIEGMEREVAIERKSKADLFGTVGSGRERFLAELDRMKQYPFAHVVVESDISEIWTNPAPHSEMKPKSVLRSVLVWTLRYPRIHWHFLPGRDVAEVWTFRLLLNAWKILNG